MASFSLLALAFVFASPVVLALSNYAGHPGPHGKLARSHASGNLTSRTSTSQLHRRFDNARCTLFETGLGACGATNSNSDFIVALNVEQFGSGEHCFDTITITYNGKSTQAQVADRCQECPFGAIDLTPSLFQFFAPTDQGVFYATWNFGSGSPPPSTTTSQPPPPSTTSTSTWTPEPTTSSAPLPPPPSTSSEPPTTSSTSTSSFSTSVESTSLSVATSTSASTSAVATPTESSMASVIDLMNLGTLQLGRVIAVAAAAAA